MSKTVTHVLVVESVSRCARPLRESGFQVEETSTFSQAVDRISHAHFDLVVLDLPEGTGLEHLARLQIQAPQTPIIVLIVAGEEKLGHEALRLGAQDFFDREISSCAELALAARKAIERHHAQAASRRDRHLLEILMDKIPDAIYFKDAESRFLRISQAHARRFNLRNPALAIGKTDADFFSGAHAGQALADEQKTMKTGQPLVGIEEMETWPDGSITWVSTTKMPLREPSGKIIGTFGISRDITSRKLAELALEERTRQLQQKNQQIEEELKMARELQLAMLPQQFPRFPPHLSYKDSALEFFSFFFPSGAVSGDFYDVVELSDTAVGVFICDVMGHDVRAALVTAMIRSLVEDLSPATQDPGELLTQINRGLASVFRQTGATMFATAFYLIADVATGDLRYASAAHPDALHLVRREEKLDVLGANGSRKGPALGLFEEAFYPTHHRPLSEGDLLILFTDGLTEAEAEGAAQEYFTSERVAAAVRRRMRQPAGQLLEGLLEETRSFCGNGGFADDVSMIGVEIKRLGAPVRAA